MSGLDESNPMTNPVDRMTDEDYNAERTAIALERAELAKLRATMSNGNGKVIGELKSVATAPKFDDSAFNAPTHVVEPQESEESNAGDTKPPPWPHDSKKMDDGQTLEYRHPDSSALIAISMVGADDFSSSQQMSIFNKFMTRHLSTTSLGYVLERMADPDDEFGLGELITVLTEE